MEKYYLRRNWYSLCLMMKCVFQLMSKAGNQWDISFERTVPCFDKKAYSALHI